MTADSSILTVLLPASGFGKRNPEISVKELMRADGKALMDFSLDHLVKAAIPIRLVVITREAKLSRLSKHLTEYLMDSNIEPLFHVFEPGAGQEWPMTILSSRMHWGEKNLVLLPDTRLSLENDQNPVDKACHVLDSGFDTFWGIHKLDDISDAKLYGEVLWNQESNSVIEICEKPSTPQSSYIWSHFGFRKSSGELLLQNLEASTHNHQPFKVIGKSFCTVVKSFTDLSRN